MYHWKILNVYLFMKAVAVKFHEILKFNIFMNNHEGHEGL
jgi:hypothetical protein